MNETTPNPITGRSAPHAKPSRRALLSGAVGAVLAPLPVTGAHPDAELLAAYAAFVAADRHLDFVNATEGWCDEEIDACGIAWRHAMEAMIAHSPRTLDGVRAKALVLRAALREEIWLGFESKLEDAAPMLRLAWSTLADILGDAA